MAQKNTPDSGAGIIELTDIVQPAKKKEGGQHIDFDGQLADLVSSKSGKTFSLEEPPELDSLLAGLGDENAQKRPPASGAGEDDAEDYIELGDSLTAPGPTVKKWDDRKGTLRSGDVDSLIDDLDVPPSGRRSAPGKEAAGGAPRQEEGPVEDLDSLLDSLFSSPAASQVAAVTNSGSSSGSSKVSGTTDDNVVPPAPLDLPEPAAPLVQTGPADTPVAPSEPGAFGEVLVAGEKSQAGTSSVDPFADEELPDLDALLRGLDEPEAPRASAPKDSPAELVASPATTMSPPPVQEESVQEEPAPQPAPAAQDEKTLDLDALLGGITDTEPAAAPADAPVLSAPEPFNVFDTPVEPEVHVEPDTPDAPEDLNMAEAAQAPDTPEAMDELDRLLADLKLPESGASQTSAQDDHEEIEAILDAALEPLAPEGEKRSPLLDFEDNSAPEEDDSFEPLLLPDELEEPLIEPLDEQPLASEDIPGLNEAVSPVHPAPTVDPVVPVAPVAEADEATEADEAETPPAEEPVEEPVEFAVPEPVLEEVIPMINEAEPETPPAVAEDEVETLKNLDAMLSAFPDAPPAPRIGDEAEGDDESAALSESAMAAEDAARYGAMLSGQEDRLVGLELSLARLEERLASLESAEPAPPQEPVVVVQPVDTSAMAEEVLEQVRADLDARAQGSDDELITLAVKELEERISSLEELEELRVSLAAADSADDAETPAEPDPVLVGAVSARVVEEICGPVEERLRGELLESLPDLMLDRLVARVAAQVSEQLLPRLRADLEKDLAAAGQKAADAEQKAVEAVHKAAEAEHKAADATSFALVEMENRITALEGRPTVKWPNTAKLAEEVLDRLHGDIDRLAAESASRVLREEIAALMQGLQE